MHIIYSLFIDNSIDTDKKKKTLKPQLLLTTQILIKHIYFYKNNPFIIISHHNSYSKKGCLRISSTLNRCFSFLNIRVIKSTMTGVTNCERPHCSNNNSISSFII